MHTPRHKEHHRKQIALAGAFVILALLAVIGNLCWENTLLRKQLDGKKPKDPSADVAATSTGSEALLIKDLDILLKYPAAWGEASSNTINGDSGVMHSIKFSKINGDIGIDYLSRDYKSDQGPLAFETDVPKSIPDSCESLLAFKTSNELQPFNKATNCVMTKKGQYTFFTMYTSTMGAGYVNYGILYTGLPKYPVLSIYGDPRAASLQDIRSVLNSVQ